MKKIIISSAALALLSVANVQAQDKNNPWTVGFGINSVDIRSGEGFGAIFSDFVTFKDNNVLPAVSKLSVGRYLGAGFSVELDGSTNKIDKGFNWKDESELNGALQLPEDKTFWAANLQLKYALKSIFTDNHYWFDPFLKLGGGYSSYGDLNDVKVLFGGGANFWFNKHVGVDVQTGYHHAFNSNATDYIQHSAGIVVKFGQRDADGDGIPDDQDLCPNEPGLPEHNGCPDTDGDGIPDKDDRCPNEAGSAEHNGCPDTDGDGIADIDDRCPNEVGPRENNGCPWPDTDGDGVLDKDDRCPNEAGPRENNGCPWPDTDGDGVLDKDDKCPRVPGPAHNQGCPEVTQAVQKKLNQFAKSITFDNGKATIRPTSYPTLDGIVETLNEYATARFTVEGHTDNVGKKANNLKLSQARANAVREYLISKGISSSRLEAVGYGDSRPKASNKTRKGKAENRRVEINLVK